MVRWFARHHQLYWINYDPKLSEKVIPDFEVGCKRVIFTHDFLPIFLEKHCTLITDDIQEITEKGPYEHAVIGICFCLCLFAL